MNSTLRVLMVEDQPADAELISEQLCQAGYEPDWKRVDNEHDYLAALTPLPEVILADHTLPQFSAERALQLLRERELDVPFIIVSGTIGEELAVKLMKHGAADYVWKNGLRRLGPAVDHALEQKRLRSEKRLAEQRVRESELWFRALIGKIHDGISVLDANGVVRYVSSSVTRILGYSPEELVGRSVLELIHPEDLASFQKATRQIVPHRGASAVSIHRVRHKDGSWRWVESAGTNFLGEPPVDGIIRNFRDVTDRKRSEEALRQAKEAAEEASRVKSRFLANMSHELRTPLNSVIGFTGMLLMKLSGPLTAEQERQLRTVEKSANHLLTLINDLLDLNRIEAGKFELKPEPLQCSDILVDVLTSLEPAAKEKGLCLVRKLPANDAPMRTDRRAVTEILLNLVNNAIKFTERGEVQVELEHRIRAGQAVAEFHVIDTGTGITQADQARLFRPFEQVNGSPKQHAGTGLGLFLSRKLAHLLGGDLWLNSEYGRGTTVTLIVPETEDGNHSGG